MFAATLALTLGVAAWSLQSNADERAALLAHRTEALRLALSGAVRSQLDLLPSLRLAASGPAPLDDAQFSRYASTLLDAGRHPGLVLGFVAERVDAAGRAGFVERIRGDRSADPAGHPSFDIQPAGERPEYMPLRHQHPPDPTNDGYDLYDPARNYRQAVEDAIAAGGLVATAPLLLARDRHRPDHPELTSIVVRAATYRGDRLPADVASRRAAATGVVGIAFRSAQVVRGALPSHLTTRARVRVTDPGSPAAAPVLDSEPGAAAATTPPRLSFVLPVADRHWQVDVTPHPSPWWQDADEATLAVLGAGLACAASLAALTAVLLRGRRDAGDDTGLPGTLAARLAGEARWRQLFDQSLDAVFITHPDGSVVAANPAACALFGRSEAELITTPKAELMDVKDPRLPVLAAARAAHGHAQGRLRLRRRDGQPFEAQISVIRQLGSDGQELSSLIVRDLDAGDDEAQVLADWQ